MRVILDRGAKKQYGKLNEPDLSRITKAINDLKEEPPKGDIEPLGNRGNQRRLRIGGYRILFEMQRDFILVTNIERRGQAYKKKTRGKK